MPTELFNIDSVDSIVRREFAHQQGVHLADLNIRTYALPANFKRSRFNFQEASNPSEKIREQVGPIAKEAEKLGYAPNIFTAVYEAILNAYQHGNKKDASKHIELGHKIDKRKLEVAVIDEGGVLDPAFAPFILRHREGRHKESVVDFYQFSGKKPESDNKGMGTFFVHLYMDNVQYFKSQENGLAVLMTKYR